MTSSNSELCSASVRAMLCLEHHFISHRVITAPAYTLKPRAHINNTLTPDTSQYFELVCTQEKNYRQPINLFSDSNSSEVVALFTSNQYLLIGQWKCGCNFKSINIKLLPALDILTIHCEIVLGWIPENLIDDQSTLIKVMAWCRQVISLCLNQCWSSPTCRHMASVGHNEFYDE